MEAAKHKDRPILFSGAMVRAILAGKKTQTRRVVPMVTRRWEIDYRGPAGPDIENPAAWGFEDENGREWALAKDDDVDFVIPCKYGQAGDRLWVRESLGYDAEYGHYFVAGNTNGGRAYLCSLFDDEEAQTGYSYDGNMPDRSVPSIHLPRRYSRITLEIAGVRVERLQEISEDDALAEGIVQLGDGGFGLPAGEHYHSADPRISYLSLWEAINGPGSVEANPWVWSVSFKTLTATGA